jgi:hypothetical protein
VKPTSVIIVSYNTRDLVLRAIGAARDPSQGVAEVIVVDNASSDGSAEAVGAAHPCVRVVVNQTNRGFAAAVNQGIRATSSPYVALLNSDAAPDPGALRRLADYLDAHPRVGAVAPRLVFPDGGFQPNCGERFESLATDLLGGDLLWRTLGGRLLALPEPHDDAPRQVAWATGACLMLRRRALDEIGLLDEGFFMYEEDLDLCLRLGRAGWEIVYLPGVRTSHVGEASPTPEQRDVLRWKLRSRDYFARKHWGRRRALARRGATALGLVLKIAALTLADLVTTPGASPRLRERRVRLAQTLRLLSFEMRRGEAS